MSEKLSSDVPPVPEYRGDIKEWARDLAIYLERILRSHNDDIQLLHETKQDA